jgi:hypothetical protein
MRLAQSRITPGSKWTFRLRSGACEVDTFHGNGRFTTGSRFGDAGTFQVNGSALTMKWTQGGDATTRFTGSYHPSQHAFSGTWFANGSFPATLTKGTSCA